MLLLESEGEALWGNDWDTLASDRRQTDSTECCVWGCAKRGSVCVLDQWNVYSFGESEVIEWYMGNRLKQMIHNGNKERYKVEKTKGLTRKRPWEVGEGQEENWNKLKEIQKVIEAVKKC